MSKLIDLTGKEFGKLKVIQKAESKVTPSGCVKTMWECICECGNVVTVPTQRLRRGETQSCGCYHTQRVIETKRDNLINMRFGRLVVIEFYDSVKGLARWKCKCDCGNESIAYSSNLKNGHTISCGCFREENRPSLRKTHGLSKTRIYEVWSRIKDRCYNPKTPCYNRYGGRGIMMCDEWRENPLAFIEWSYQNGYDENAPYGECTLDRIDNNKGYSPNNCRWVNEQIQANNRRSNRIIEHNREKHTLAEWTRILGVSNSKLIWHLDKGRTIQDVIDNYLD